MTQITNVDLARVLDACTQSRIVVVATRPGAGVARLAAQLGVFACPGSVGRGAPPAAFRAPHHTVSVKGLREEIELCRGVLYLDDAQCYDLERLGQASNWLRHVADLTGFMPLTIVHVHVHVDPPSYWKHCNGGREIWSAVSGNRIMVDQVRVAAPWDTAKHGAQPGFVDLTDGGAR